MKTQIYGFIHLAVNILAVDKILSHPTPSCIRYYALQNYLENRENGTNDDSPKNNPFPSDGKYTWIKGTVDGNDVYGVKEGDMYVYEVQYDEGPGDKKWMEEKDHNYLARLEMEKTLEKFELGEFKKRQLQLKIPNEKTMRAIKETENGVGLIKCKDANDLFRKLGLSDAKAKVQKRLSKKR